MVESNPVLTTVLLRSLLSVGGKLALQSNSQLVSAELPLLETAGRVSVAYNSVQTALHLDTLTTVEGDLFVGYNDDLTDVSVPAVRHVGTYLDFTGDGALVDISVPALLDVGLTLLVTSNDHLRTFSAPALETVGKGLTLGGDEIAQGLPLLTSANLDALDQVGTTLTVKRTALTCAAIERFCGATAASKVISLNAEDGCTCPP